ncbi:MAG: glycosyltransferase family 9 protein [Actinobacteria bacterium]|nr:MAG: glycosyltransferase family 9 protein [Actinomycetota bacterium]
MPEPDVDKIAVLRANAVGDYIFALPALDALRSAYPRAEIVLLGAPWHARFLTGRPGPVDRVVELPPLPGVRDPGPGERPGDADRFLAALREERFDLALQLHGGGRHTNPLVAGLGARITAGLRAPDAAPLDRWTRYVYYQPEVFRYLEVVRLVGAAPVTYHPRLELTDDDRKAAAALVPETGRPLVALHPGSTDERRRWPAERFAAVGDALAAAGAEILVTGTGPERPVVARVLGTMRHPARPLVDALPLGGLAALYARCAVVISNDTGPVHLAEAVGAATVGLYWVGNLINGAPVDRHRHRPLLSWTIHCPECGLDCTRDLYPARGGGSGCAHSPSFVADIPVAEVVEAVADLLGH